MTECARRESKERRPWSVYRHALLACFDPPRRHHMIPLQPTLYYILLNFIKLYSAPSALGASRYSIFINVLLESDSPEVSISTNVSLRSRFRPLSIFTNVSPGSGVRDSQSSPMFARHTLENSAFITVSDCRCPNAQSRIGLSTLTEDL